MNTSSQQPSGRRRVETRAVHVRVPELDGSRPLSTPIYQTSTFALPEADEMTDGLNRPDGAFVYSRYTNPTVRALENAVADLEGGVAAIATSSGMGAINAVGLALLRPGDHVITQRRLYGGTFEAFAHFFRKWGVEATMIDVGDPKAVKEALRPTTRMLYLETLSNPTAGVTDLPAFTAAGREAGLVTVVDNTFATPVLCQPLELGADIVVHSATKYLNGHSDVVGGVAVFADTRHHDAVWRTSLQLGTSADPFAAWLTLRGLHTLPLRVRAHCATADTLAHRLAQHPSVAAVHWPGLATHPDHALAQRLLPYGYGGVFAFDIVGGREAGHRFVSGLRLASHGPSLGGIETLILHPASSTHRQLDERELSAVGIGQGTIRVATGLEHVDDLWEDITQALTRAAAKPAS